MSDRKYRCKRCGGPAEWVPVKGEARRVLSCVGWGVGGGPAFGVCEVCGDLPVEYYPNLGDPVCQTCKLV